MNLNVEWLSPTFDEKLFYPFFLSVVALIFAGLRYKKIRFTAFELLTVAVFVIASFSSRRYIPFYSIVVALPLARLFASLLNSDSRASAVLAALARIDIKERRATSLECSSVLAVVFILLTFSGKIQLTSADGLEELYPSRALVEFREQTRFESNNVRVFHTPDWGGYLIWHLWPKYRLFIDDRNYLNGEQKYRDYFTLSKAEDGWRALVDKYSFNWMILQPDLALTETLKSDDQWQNVYADEKALLFRRSAQ
jgi:hypothetical protein